MDRGVFSFLEKLGLRDIKPRKDELMAWCPFHDETSYGAFSVNANTGLYFCFSCKAKGSIFEYAASKNIPYQAVFRQWQVLQKEYVPDILENKKLDKSLVRYYMQCGYSDYAQKRMRDFDILYKYNVYSDKLGNPIFLVRNHRGDYKAAWMKDIQSGQYYLIEPENSKENGDIFGEHLPPTDFTVVTEGFFDAMWVNKMTGQRAVCLSGTHATECQVKTLINLQPLVFMLDGDYIGRTARNALRASCGHLDIKFCGGYRGDPDEKSAKELWQIINNAKDVFEFDLCEKE